MAAKILQSCRGRKSAGNRRVRSPVAATAAATACRAAGFALAALAGLAGTATNTGAAGADPGASPVTACTLAAEPESAAAFLRFPDMSWMMSVELEAGDAVICDA